MHLSCALCLGLKRISRLLRLLDDAIKQFPLHATHEIRCAFIRDLFTSMKLHALFRIIQNNKKFVPKRGGKGVRRLSK
jgi:hypothetical protein